MDRLFVRFIKFPDDNVSISVMDRVSLVAMFGIPGRDYQCPNVMGCLLTKTNGGRLFHEVNLMTGMSRSDLKSTFVHECAHAWMVENLPPARNVAISGDAKEGFCELVSHMVMDSLGDQAAINAIKQNTYTRG
ncbi:MAG TPA: hypothetical protein PKA41_18725, partial [Verrucomicrobiota bacterium]|nr:hypothetical protein [Verrucomicrobiota bacterium]